MLRRHSFHVVHGVRTGLHVDARCGGMSRGGMGVRQSGSQRRRHQRYGNQAQQHVMHESDHRSSIVSAVM